MTIAIDIDGTWDRDPELFFTFAQSAWARGHTVIVVTGRQQPQEKLDRLMLSRAPIDELLVSGDELKDAFCRRIGIKVDVWIDNEPGKIQRCNILEDGKYECYRNRSGSV